MTTPTEAGALVALTELGNVIAALRLELAQALHDCRDYDAELRDMRAAKRRAVSWDDVQSLMQREGVTYISAQGTQWWAVANGSFVRSGATIAAAVAATQADAATPEAQP